MGEGSTVQSKIGNDGIVSVWITAASGTGVSYLAAMRVQLWEQLQQCSSTAYEWLLHNY